jgi:DNA-binding transcriptional MerR regulator
MSSDDPHPESGAAADSPDGGEIAYSIEVIARLAGVDATTVVRYHEQGYLQPVCPEGSTTLLFDAECLRQLRRIEHLRTTCGVNETGLKLILQLIAEVEQLREERRKSMR